MRRLESQKSGVFLAHLEKKGSSAAPSSPPPLFAKLTRWALLRDNEATCFIRLRAFPRPRCQHQRRPLRCTSHRPCVLCVRVHVVTLPYTHTPLGANARWRSCSTHSFDSLFVQSYDTYTLNPPNHRAASDCWHCRRGSLSDDQTKDTSSFPPLSPMELSGTPPPIFRTLLKSTISWKGGGGGAFRVPTNSYVPGAQYTE